MSSIQYKKTSKRATKRKNVKVDTRDIRDGEVRIGPKGQRNVYDKKTGRWYRATKRRPLTYKSKKTASGTTTVTKRTGDRSVTSGTVSSALKTKKPRSGASVKGALDRYADYRRTTRADIQNLRRPIKMSVKRGMTINKAQAILASKTASKLRKDAARKFIEGRK